MKKQSVIKVVQGIIKAEENELESECAVFYWANFVPHYDGKTVFVIGECEKETFVFKYDLETDAVLFSEKYRICLCSPEVYNKYYLNIKMPNNEQLLVIPWIKFSTKGGVAIPQLIERILGNIPASMVFL